MDYKKQLESGKNSSTDAGASTKLKPAGSKGRRRRSGKTGTKSHVRLNMKYHLQSNNPFAQYGLLSNVGTEKEAGDGGEGKKKQGENSRLIDREKAYSSLIEQSRLGDDVFVMDFQNRKVPSYRRLPLIARSAQLLKKSEIDTSLNLPKHTTQEEPEEEEPNLPSALKTPRSKKSTSKSQTQLKRTPETQNLQKRSKIINLNFNHIQSQQSLNKPIKKRNRFTKKSKKTFLRKSVDSLPKRKGFLFKEKSHSRLNSVSNLSSKKRFLRGLSQEKNHFLNNKEKILRKAKLLGAPGYSENIITMKTEPNAVLETTQSPPYHKKRPKFEPLRKKVKIDSEASESVKNALKLFEKVRIDSNFAVERAKSIINCVAKSKTPAFVIPSNYDQLPELGPFSSILREESSNYPENQQKSENSNNQKIEVSEQNEATDDKREPNHDRTIPPLKLIKLSQKKPSRMDRHFPKRMISAKFFEFVNTGSSTLQKRLPNNTRVYPTDFIKAKIYKTLIKNQHDLHNSFFGNQPTDNSNRSLHLLEKLKGSEEWNQAIHLGQNRPKRLPKQFMFKNSDNLRTYNYRAVRFDERDSEEIKELKKELVYLYRLPINLKPAFEHFNDYYLPLEDPVYLKELYEEILKDEPTILEALLKPGLGDGSGIKDGLDDEALRILNQKLEELSEIDPSSLGPKARNFSSFFSKWKKSKTKSKMKTKDDLGSIEPPEDSKKRIKRRKKKRGPQIKRGKRKGKHGYNKSIDPSKFLKDREDEEVPGPGSLDSLGKHRPGSHDNQYKENGIKTYMKPSRWRYNADKGERSNEGGYYDQEGLMMMRNMANNQLHRHESQKSINKYIREMNEEIIKRRLSSKETPVESLETEGKEEQESEEKSKRTQKRRQRDPLLKDNFNRDGFKPMNKDKYTDFTKGLRRLGDPWEPNGLSLSPHSIEEVDDQTSESEGDERDQSEDEENAVHGETLESEENGLKDQNMEGNGEIDEADENGDSEDLDHVDFNISNQEVPSNGRDLFNRPIYSQDFDYESDQSFPPVNTPKTDSNQKEKKDTLQVPGAHKKTDPNHKRKVKLPSQLIKTDRTIPRRSLTEGVKFTPRAAENPQNENTDFQNRSVDGLEELSKLTKEISGDYSNKSKIIKKKIKFFRQDSMVEFSPGHFLNGRKIPKKFEKFHQSVIQNLSQIDPQSSTSELDYTNLAFQTPREQLDTVKKKIDKEVMKRLISAKRSNTMQIDETKEKKRRKKQFDVDLKRLQKVIKRDQRQSYNKAIERIGKQKEKEAAHGPTSCIKEVFGQRAKETPQAYKIESKIYTVEERLPEVFPKYMSKWMKIILRCSFKEDFFDVVDVGYYAFMGLLENVQCPVVKYLYLPKEMMACYIQSYQMFYKVCVDLDVDAMLMKGIHELPEEELSGLGKPEYRETKHLCKMDIKEIRKEFGKHIQPEGDVWDGKFKGRRRKRRESRKRKSVRVSAHADVARMKFFEEGKRFEDYLKVRKAILAGKDVELNGDGVMSNGGGELDKIEENEAPGA